MVQLIFDNSKRLANIDKHGFDFADLTFEFFIISQILSAQNERYKAVGHFKKKIVIVIFKPLSVEAISIISMCSASKKERSFLS